MRKKLPPTVRIYKPKKKQRRSSNGCSHAQGDQHVTTSDNTFRLLPPITLLLCATAMGQIGAVRVAWSDPNTGSRGAVLGEGVVPARQYEENTQAVPESIAVIGDETIINSHLTRREGLNSLVSNL